MPDSWWWAGQLFAVAQSAAVVFGMWTINRRRVVVAGWLGGIFGTLGWAFQGVLGAAAINLVNIARGVTVEPLRESRPAVKRAVTAGFIAVSWASYLLLSGIPDLWWEWLPMASNAVLIVAVSSDSIRTIKWFSLGGSAGWLVFKLITGNWGSLVGEVVGLTSVLVALVRVHSPHRQTSAARPLGTQKRPQK